MTTQLSARALRDTTGGRDRSCQRSHVEAVDAWLLDQYDLADPELKAVHERRPIFELLDDHAAPECGFIGAQCYLASGDARWPRPMLWADLDEIEAAVVEERSVAMRGMGFA